MPRLEAHVAGQRTVAARVLLPSERRLLSGSVLEVMVDILDPTGYRLYPPGLLAEAVETTAP